MKALVLNAYGGTEHLTVADVPIPHLENPGHVLIRMHRASLNHLDLWVLQGLPGVEHEFPHIMVGDGAGVIEQVGDAVTEFAVGDRVMINPGVSCYQCEMCLAGEHSLCSSYRLFGEHLTGSAAEFMVVPASNCALVPPNMGWDQAAAFSLVTLTAWRMLSTRGRLAPGETILIWGIGGGVAQAALQIAKLIGARAIVTSSSDDKLERAAKLGADIGLNHGEVDVAREIRRLTDKRGVDLVVDNVGKETWQHSLRCLKPRGRLVTCGGTTGPMVTMDIRRLFWFQYDIMGSTMGSYQEYQDVVRFAGQGKLWPVIDSVVPLEDGPTAFDRLQDADHFGKVVIDISGED
jgi:NADPH:quinone reductase-like Zn-dependent oxidoreductase